MLNSHEHAGSAKDELFSALERDVASADFGASTIYVLFGYPQSDIGKAHLIARLGVLLKEDFSIIKFDGFLNTNLDGRYPSRTHHDFVVYREFHSHIAFGGSNRILAGPLLMDFLARYGESREHLMFRPHVAYFFVTRLFQNWVQLGKPAVLLVEIGGTLVDEEVTAYVVPAICFLQARHKRTRLFLLTEAGYSGECVKARNVVSGVEAGSRCGLRFDLLFVRLPATIPSANDYADVEGYIQAKVSTSLAYRGDSPRVVCVPHYPGPELRGYTELLASKRQHIFMS